MAYKTLRVDVKNKIAFLTLTQPKKFNAMEPIFWQEIIDAFEEIDDGAARVTVINGEGKHFTSGLDLKEFGNLGFGSDLEVGRRAEYLRRLIIRMQKSFNVIEKSRMPVIAAIHGACIGGGIDMISACDMRYASQDAFFSIHEINIGMAADVGTLQRLPHLMPHGLVRELAYTGRRMTAEEGLHSGLLNAVLPNKEELTGHVMHVAEQIVSNSPVALSGIKEMLTYARDHNVVDGLNYVATWNSAMLQSKDFHEAIRAQVQKKRPVFEDLPPLPSLVKEK